MRAANGDGLETVVVRPRFVWGRGDTTLLPALVELVRSGRFRWVGGGRHLTATTHVDNTVEGLWLGATKAQPGGVYFVTDGEPVVFREFVSRMLATQGVTPSRTNPCRGRGAARPPRRSRRIWRLRRRFDSLAAAHPLRRLGFLAGVHDRHLAGAPGARLRAREVPRGGPRGDGGRGVSARAGCGG